MHMLHIENNAGNDGYEHYNKYAYKKIPYSWFFRIHGFLHYFFEGRNSLTAEK